VNLSKETDRLLARADELGAAFQRQSSSHSGVRAVEGADTEVGEQVADSLRDLEGKLLDHVGVLSQHVKTVNTELRRLSAELVRTDKTRDDLHEPGLLDDVTTKLRTLTEVTHTQRSQLLDTIERIAKTLHHPLEDIWVHEPGLPTYSGRTDHADSIDDLLDL